MNFQHIDPAITVLVPPGTTLGADTTTDYALVVGDEGGCRMVVEGSPVTLRGWARRILDRLDGVHETP
jgi:hypothetical protein